MPLHTVRAKLFMGMGTVMAAFIFLSMVVVNHVAHDFGEEELSRNLKIGRDALTDFLEVRRSMLQARGQSTSNFPRMSDLLSDLPDAEFGSDSARQLADQLRRATGCDVMLFHDGRKLADSHARLNCEPLVCAEKLATLREMSDAGKRAVRVETNGETSLCLWHGAADFQVVLARSLNEFSVFTQRVKQHLIGLGVLIGGVAVLVCLAISKRLSQPIAELLAAAQAMADGNLSVDVKVYRDDELGQLSATFNAMARRIEKLVRDVKTAAEDVQQASQAKSNFLANISHEFRTPLNSIIGFNALLLEQTETLPQDATTVSRLEWLRTIDCSSRQLLGVIEDILDVSKLSENQLNVEIAPCNPIAAIEGVLKEFHSQASEKGLKLTLRQASNVPTEIETDVIRFQQMISNVLGNAVKFTRCGTVDVTVQTSKFNGTAVLEVIVTDTGIGIAADRLDAIFEPFVQADGSMTREFGGTGLGLTLARRIAEALGGSLTVSSLLGAGSCFTCKIALQPSENQSSSSDDFSKPHTIKESDTDNTLPATDGAYRELVEGCLTQRVLVVDDTAANRRLISLILRKAGATVVEAVNGEEAIQQFEQSPFDIILMDMQMPKVDGYAATRAIRATGATLPIVALTAHAMPGDRETCIKAGCSHYLTKPVSHSTLITLISAACSQPVA